MNELRETYEVASGDTLRIGASYFLVKEVREPSHPAFPGLVFEGHAFDTRRGVWGRAHNLSARFDEKWHPVTNLDFPDRYLSAYLAPGDLAIVEDYANGSSLWTYEVKCKVLDFGEKESFVKITGQSWQFFAGTEVTVPTQVLYRRKVKK